MNPSQIAQMLRALPQSCAMDASAKVAPPVSPDMARYYLLQLEEQGFVTWKRGKPSNISLTAAGLVLLVEYENQKL